MTRRLVRTVDHRVPIHDGFCRCRTCKPPLVSQRDQRREDRMLLLILLVVLILLGPALLNLALWKA